MLLYASILDEPFHSFSEFEYQPLNLNLINGHHVLNKQEQAPPEYTEAESVTRAPLPLVLTTTTFSEISRLFLASFVSTYLSVTSTILVDARDV